MALRPSQHPAARAGRVEERIPRYASLYSLGYLYALLPFSLICVYYLIIFFVGLELAEAIGFSVTSMRNASNWGQFATHLSLFSVFTALLILLMMHLSSAVIGLLTQSQDAVAEVTAGVELSRAESPEVFATVAEVGARIGALLPDEIRVTYLPECYAAEIRWFAVSTKRRLVLVLGLPHIAVLTVGELKVLLAHELAHFSGDTRLTVFVYRFLNTLRNTINAESGRWRRYVDPCYWYTWAYFHFIFALAGPVLRRQELNADRASAAFYGGGLAAKTLLKEWLITQQFDTAMATFPGNETRDQRTLFAYFDDSHRVFSDEGLSYLEQRLAELETPTIWDSHPSMEKRLKAVRQFEGDEDEDPRPARELIADYRNLAVDLHEQAMLEMSSTVEFPGFPPD